MEELSSENDMDDDDQIDPLIHTNIHAIRMEQILNFQAMTETSDPQVAASFLQ